MKNLIFLSLLYSLVYSEALRVGNVFTLSARDLGESVEFTVETLTPNVGWAAFGFGTSMDEAEIFICWPFHNQVIVSRRYSTTTTLPVYQPSFQQQTLNSDASQVSSNNTFTAVFSRSKIAPPLKGHEVDITENMNMIYAYSMNGVLSSNPGAQFAEHTDRGKQLNVQVFSAVQVQAVTGGVDAVVNIYKWHGIILFIAWMVCAPAAIFIARFLKAALGVWWFRIHIVLLLFGTVGLTLAGFFLALNQGSSNTSSAFVAHKVFGWFVLITCLLQVVLGFVIDRLFDPERKSIPWYDKVHWWLGRLSFLVSWITIPIGLSLYQKLSDSLSVVVVVFLAVYMFLIIALFIVKQFMHREEPHLPTKQMEEPAANLYNARVDSRI